MTSIFNEIGVFVVAGLALAGAGKWAGGREQLKGWEKEKRSTPDVQIERLQVCDVAIETYKKQVVIGRLLAIGGGVLTWIIYLSAV